MHSFGAYEQGIQRLLQTLGSDHPAYPEALTLHSRLAENIAHTRQYGDTETRRADRAQIVAAFNRLALRTLQTSFNELCEPRANSPLVPAVTRPETLERADRPSLPELPPCPFIAGPKIMDPRLFVGRKEELHRLVTAMGGVQPTSVNVVGERRIGKSSLLYHLYQTWEQRVQTAGRHIVAYRSLQDAAAQREKDFYQAIARALLARPKVQQQSALVTALDQQRLDRQGFAAAMRRFQAHNLLPVLCLDEFEALLQYPRQFDDGFYDALRALMDDNALMLVVASLKPLDVYRRRHGLTSSFFNLGHVLILRELAAEEVTDLLRLPASTVSGAAAALGLEEQRLAREWGGAHPCLLQLAACFLCRARQEGKDVAWAQARFKSEARRIPRSGYRLRRLWAPLHWLVWDLPARLGRLARGLGEAVDEMSNVVIGVVILTIVLLALLGILTGPQIADLLRQALGR